MTYSVMGALPVGVLITSDEKMQTLLQGFNLLKSCYKQDAFGGRGERGPAVIMTDNCSELFEALSRVWPEAILILCTFHVLQQVWR